MVADWLAVQADEVIETSCARIFLVGEEAWKIKRPVRFPFLDFSTRAKRRWAIERELAFNRRWAGDIYRRVVPVRRAGATLSLDGSGEAAEWMLMMRRFDPNAVLGECASAVDGDLGERLGRQVARMHAEAETAPDGGGAATLGYTIATNERALADIPGRKDAVLHLVEATRTARDAVADDLDRRQGEGFSRHCHGDLHLGNILCENGRLIPFDCIEFNDRLSRIDVLYDVAFPIMDLVVRGRGEAANRLLNGYLDEAARTFPPGLWAGLRLLPLFMSVRAAVRAHVTAATGDQAVSDHYLSAAELFLNPARPRLWAVGGLSGSGKTRLARTLASLLDHRAGAVVLRSDEIRKRLWGAAAEAPLPAAVYDGATDARVYEAMFETASAILAAGRSAILDATFLAEQDRKRTEAVARRCGAPFSAVWLEGEPGLLRERLSGRGRDASDATAAVLERQLVRGLGPIDWLRAPAAEDSAALAARLAAS